MSEKNIEEINDIFNLLNKSNSEDSKAQNTEISSVDVPLAKAKNQIKSLEKELKKVVLELEFYKKILKLPLEDIALNSEEFKMTYEEFMLKYALELVELKAFKELSYQLGQSKGLSKDDIIKLSVEKEMGVLDNKHNPAHNTVANNVPIIKKRLSIIKPIVYKKLIDIRGK